MNYIAILFVAIVVLVIVRKARQFLRAMVPPPRIHLEPTRAVGNHARDVKRYERELVAAGFTRIGTYRVDPMRGVVLTSFALSRESLCAVVYTHPVVGNFVDVICQSEAGQTFTATTAPAGKELDQREGHEKVFDRAMTVPRLIETVLQRRPHGPLVNFGPGNFTRLFEDAYAKEMDWRAGRGGVTSDEVRRTAEAMGGKYSEQDVQEATRRLQRQYVHTRRDMR